MNDTPKRFRVAFSFAGEKRDFVARLAAILAARFSEAAILYDKYHKAEFARRDLGSYLPDLYYDQTDLVIAVLCRNYQQKNWCGREWCRISNRENSAVMLCRFDYATAEGLSEETSGFVELDDMGPHQAAACILERLASNDGKPIDYFHSNPFKATKPNVHSSFIGRKKEIAEIEELIIDHSILTLTGPGGCGKTRLAWEVAEGAWSQFPDGWCLTDLAPLSPQASVEDVGDEVASKLVPTGQDVRPPMEILADYFSKKKTLLILDNCEHLAAACAVLIHEIVNLNKNIRIIATSQVKLKVTGQEVFNVDPLEHADAVRLFVERARSHDRKFREEKADAVQRICRRLDGIPLAIEFAAAWVETLPVERIDEELKDALARLKQGSPNAPARHQTLLATMEWSYRLLTDELRSLLSRLSVFRGGWNLQAMSQICELESRDKVDLLHELVEKSMVLAKPLRLKSGACDKRYKLLETVRQFAAAQLIKAEEETLQKRHRDWYLTFAEERAHVLQEGGDQDRVLQEIELEHDNLRSALDSYTAKSEWGSALRLCAALWRFWENRRLSEGRKDLKQLIDTVEELGPGFVAAETAKTVAALGTVYSAGGMLAYRQGDGGDAMVLFKRAFEIEEKLGDRKRIANCLNDLGLAAQFTGNLQGALKYYRDYLAMARNIGAKREIAIGLFNVGNTEMRLGNFEDARPSLVESRKLFKELAHSDIAYPMTALGWLAVFDNDAAAAEGLFAESLKRREQLEHKRGMVDCWNGLGRAAILRDDFEETRRHLTAGLSMAREIGADKAIAQIIESFAILAVRENEMVKALTLSSAAKALREKIQSPRTPAFAKEQEQWMEKAKGALAADKSAGALDAGLTMELDDIINGLS